MAGTETDHSAEKRFADEGDAALKFSAAYITVLACHLQTVKTEISQASSVPAQMLIHKGRDEIIGMVIAFPHIQCERDGRLGTGFL